MFFMSTFLRRQSVNNVDKKSTTLTIVKKKIGGDYVARQIKETWAVPHQRLKIYDKQNLK